jgi:hypothetical protein
VSRVSPSCSKCILSQRLYGLRKGGWKDEGSQGASHTAKAAGDPRSDTMSPELVPSSPPAWMVKSKSRVTPLTPCESHLPSKCRHYAQEYCLRQPPASYQRLWSTFLILFPLRCPLCPRILPHFTPCFKSTLGIYYSFCDSARPFFPCCHGH